MFNIFTVQSNTHDNRDLLARFEAFLEGYLQELGRSQLTEEQFNTIKLSLLHKLHEPAKNTKDMGNLLDYLMVNYDADFDWLNKRIVGMEGLTYQDQLKLTHEFLGRQNKQRLAILLNGEIPKESGFTYNKARTWNSVRKMSSYEPGQFSTETRKSGPMNGYKD
jgi:insulysin